MPDANNTGTAMLRVLVTTALGALPLEGTNVTVTTAANSAGERTLLHSVRTDRDGMTPPMSLPVPARAESLSPDFSGQPYALYTVYAEHEGYTPFAALNVAMFADTPSMLPISLVPLPENAPRGAAHICSEGNPQCLYQSTASEKE